MSESTSNHPPPPAPERPATADLAFADDLTGLHNRRYLRRLFETEWSGLVEREGRVALLLLDLDLFKEVNDRHGHLAGDAVLCAAARRLRESFRDGDRVVRYGGDEFVVVLPGAGAEEARRLAERARSALATERWIDPATGSTIDLPLSFSVGVAAAPEAGRTGEAVLALADRGLYDEKRARRAALAAALRPSGRRRLSRALVALLAAAAVAAFGWLAWPRPLAPPPAGPSAETRLVAAEELARREAEIRALREEVDRLHAAVAAASSASERERFERRILELESALERRAAAVPAGDAPPAAAVAPPPSAPMAQAERAPAPPEEASPTPAPRAAAAASALPAVPVLVPPQLLRHRPPVYPPMALARGLEALIDFRIRVDREGRVVRVEPLGPPAGAGFDEAARAAALSALYRPGTRDGEPAEMETRLRIEFKLGARR